MVDEIILVDGKDNEIGWEEKDACHHIPSRLHRAFSIFIINKQGHMLIHQRAAGKKTWPGFWSNACCSHPRKGEDLSEAITRRLHEELGFTCPLQHIFTFRYKADYNRDFGENEIDHVFVGEYDGTVKPNRDEIQDWKFISMEELLSDVRRNPQIYTPWFKKALPKVVRHVTGGSPKTTKSGITPVSN